MANLVPTLTVKTMPSATAANLDAAVATQMAVLKAKLSQSDIKTAPVGLGTVQAGSIMVTQYQAIISSIDVITYTCQMQWIEFI